MEDFFWFLSDLLDFVTSPKKERRVLLAVIALVAVAVTVGLAVRFYVYP